MAKLLPAPGFEVQRAINHRVISQTRRVIIPAKRKDYNAGNPRKTFDELQENSFSP
jgi:hypothetical protein